MSLNDVDKSFQEIKAPIPLSYRSQSNNTARGYTARPEDTLTSREKGVEFPLTAYISHLLFTIYKSSYTVYVVKFCVCICWLTYLRLICIFFYTVYILYVCTECCIFVLVL